MPASVSATYSSTVAEELVALLRRLHALEAWNPLINKFISGRLSRIVTMATPTEGETDVVCVTFAWFEITVNKSHMFVRPSVCLFVCLCVRIRSFVSSLILSSIYSSVRPIVSFFARLFVLLFACLCICSFVHSFIHPFVHSQCFTNQQQLRALPCIAKQKQKNKKLIILL